MNVQGDPQGLQGWLERAVQSGASDLHLSAGQPPWLRVHGTLAPLAGEPISAEALQRLLTPWVDAAEGGLAARQLAQAQACDFALALPGLGRFRANVFVQQRGWGAVFRLIAAEVPTLPSLDAPAVLADLALRDRGLVLVCGATGCGKSTTLAAMLRHRSEQQAGHILTLEDPIEFMHANRRSLVHQREVGRHVPGFADGLRSALREDPDCILVGELRDLDTVRLALTAAETGHLVLATLHSASAAKAVDRLVDVFPGDEKALVRTMLSESLQAAVYQTLCPVLDGAGRVNGRVAAHEILLGTPAVRNLIREGKSAQIVSVMQTSQAQGMQTLEQSLAALSRRVRLAPDLPR